MLPDYNSADADKKAAATSQWNKINQALWEVKYAATELAVESGKLASLALENMEKSGN